MTTYTALIVFIDASTPPRTENDYLHGINQKQCRNIAFPPENDYLHGINLGDWAAYTAHQENDYLHGINQWHWGD